MPGDADQAPGKGHGLGPLPQSLVWTAVMSARAHWAKLEGSEGEMARGTAKGSVTGTAFGWARVLAWEVRPRPVATGSAEHWSVSGWRSRAPERGRARPAPAPSGPQVSPRPSWDGRPYSEPSSGKRGAEA